MGSTKSIKIAATSEQLAAEYRAGATIREIARAHGCSFQNVRMRLIAAGVEMRPVGHGGNPSPLKTCPTCGCTFKASYSKQRFCCSQHIRKVSVCKRGHVLTEENRYHFPGSASQCKECAHIRGKAYRERKKAQGQIEE